jgi:ABC-type multidrug transport system fused ATPase/permease subunit
MRYPLLPIGFIVLALIAISAFTYTSFQIQQAFQVIESKGTVEQLLLVSLGLLGLRAAFAVVDMINTVIREFLASRMERDAREELYISLLSKSQTFHNRQRVGDLMAAATGDVSQLNLMISPGVSLIIEATTQLITPLVAIAALNPALLPVPGDMIGLVCHAVPFPGSTSSTSNERATQNPAPWGTIWYKEEGISNPSSTVRHVPFRRMDRESPAAVGTPTANWGSATDGWAATICTTWPSH